MQVQYFTLVYFLYHFEQEQATRVMLGLKRTKLCAEKYVGIGGKLHPGESLQAGALREIAEELPGATFDQQSLELRALLTVTQGDCVNKVFTMTGRLTSEFLPLRSEEFHSFGWWSLAALPEVSKLPRGDALWLPRALNADAYAPCRVDVSLMGEVQIYDAPNLGTEYPLELSP